jgi:hypothetical protein
MGPVGLGGDQRRLQGARVSPAVEAHPYARRRPPPPPVFGPTDAGTSPDLGTGGVGVGAGLLSAAPWLLVTRRPPGQVAFVGEGAT